MKQFHLFLLGALACLMCSCGSTNAEINQAKDELRQEVKMAQSLVGHQIDMITTMTSCEFEDPNIVYTYSIDEESVSMDDIENSRSILKTNIVATISNNPQCYSMKKNLKKIQGQIIYTYMGSKTSQTMTITIDADEL